MAGLTRLEHTADSNLLEAIKNFQGCFIGEEAKACDADMLQHFQAYVRMHEKHINEGNGEYAKIAEGIPPPPIEL